jgi:hypothetical protein
MSLDFDVSKVKNFAVVTTFVEQDGNKIWHPITKALVFGTMAIGMNNITEANWEEFYNRLNLWELCAGPSLWRSAGGTGDPKNHITPLEVFMHIGLHTNASRKTDKQFLDDCFRVLKDNNRIKPSDIEEQYNLSGLSTMTLERYSLLTKVERFEDQTTLDGFIQRHMERKHLPSSAYWLEDCGESLESLQEKADQKYDAEVTIPYSDEHLGIDQTS